MYAEGNLSEVTSPTDTEVLVNHREPSLDSGSRIRRTSGCSQNKRKRRQDDETQTNEALKKSRETFDMTATSSDIREINLAYQNGFTDYDLHTERPPKLCEDFCPAQDTDGNLFLNHFSTRKSRAVRDAREIIEERRRSSRSLGRSSDNFVPNRSPVKDARHIINERKVNRLSSSQFLCEDVIEPPSPGDSGYYKTSKKCQKKSRFLKSSADQTVALAKKEFEKVIDAYAKSSKGICQNFLQFCNTFDQAEGKKPQGRRRRCRKLRRKAAAKQPQQTVFKTGKHCSSA